MNFPSFPTDSLYKFLFLAGLFLCVFAFLMNRDTSDKIEDNDNTIARLYKSATADEHELAYAVNKNLKKDIAIQSDLISKFTNVNKTDRASLSAYEKYLSFEKNILDSLGKVNGSKEQELKDLNRTVDSANSTYLAQRSKMLKLADQLNICTIIGVAMFIIGLIGWVITQRWQDAILKKQYLESIGNDRPCQSCGMIMKYDPTYTEGQEYCHHCHDGNGFVEPALTLPQMKQKVAVRMRQLGFSKVTIALHNWKLIDLDRWKQAFKW
jgi:hypothetical protein